VQAPGLMTHSSGEMLYPTLPHLGIAVTPKGGDELHWHAPRYCAPEVLLHLLSGATTIQRVAAHDMWSVGVVMYELYTGRRLFGEVMTDEDVKTILCSVSVLPPFLQPAFVIRRRATTPPRKKLLSPIDGLHWFNTASTRACL
jgi:serine/threonine protein kinase